MEQQHNAHRLRLDNIRKEHTAFWTRHHHCGMTELALLLPLNSASNSRPCLQPHPPLSDIQSSTSSSLRGLLLLLQQAPHSSQPGFLCSNIAPLPLIIKGHAGRDDTEQDASDDVDPEPSVVGGIVCAQGTRWVMWLEWAIGLGD